MGMLDFLTNPQQAATDTVNNVTNGAVDTVKRAGGSIITAPFRMVSGAISGAFGSLWNIVKFTGIAAAVQLIAPNLVTSLVGAIGGPAALEKYRASRQDNSLGSILTSSLEVGGGTAVALGAVKGASDSAGPVMTALAIAAGAAVTIGAIHKGDVKVAANDSNPTPPPTVPGAKLKAEAVKGA